MKTNGQSEKASKIEDRGFRDQILGNIKEHKDPKAVRETIEKYFREKYVDEKIVVAGIKGFEKCLQIQIEVEGEETKNLLKIAYDSETLSRVQQDIQGDNNYIKAGYIRYIASEGEQDSQNFYKKMRYYEYDYQHAFMGNIETAKIGLAYFLDYCGIPDLINEYKNLSPAKYNLLQTLKTSNCDGVARNYLEAVIERTLNVAEKTKPWREIIKGRKDLEVKVPYSKLKEFTDLIEVADLTTSAENCLKEDRRNINTICGLKTPVVLCPPDFKPSNFIFKKIYNRNEETYRAETAIIDQPFASDPRLINGLLPFAIGYLKTWTSDDPQISSSITDELFKQLNKNYIGKYSSEKDEYIELSKKDIWVPNKGDIGCNPYMIRQIGINCGKIFRARSKLREADQDLMDIIYASQPKRKEVTLDKYTVETSS